MVLGVSRDDILADYLETNEQRKPHKAAILRSAAERGATEHQLTLIEATLSVRAEFLLAALEAAEVSGSIERFIAQRLNFWLI